MNEFPNLTSIPFAMFRFAGNVVTLNKAQWEQCLRDARLCKCGKTESCLCCRAAEYARDNEYKA